MVLRGITPHVMGLVVAFFALLLPQARAADDAWTLVHDASPAHANLLAAASGGEPFQVRKLRLANGMQVYLLHDPRARTVATACGVRAGSWQNPTDAPGMAHFVEHLLFMGTQEYPNEDDFYAYLGRHGGNTNAYTTVDRTVYMFDVEPTGFNGSLRRFAAFFKHPLLRNTSIERERSAVDQEYRAKERIDGWRELMVDAALSDPRHPNHVFSLGSEETLAHVDQERMQAWFLQHYSANVMDLVVRGPQSLETLQAAVVSAFGSVENRHVQPPRIASSLLDHAAAGRVVVIAPIKAQTRELSVKWEVPVGPDDRAGQQACALLGYILDNQAPGSLLAHLRAACLADDISILPRHFATGNTVLTVSFDLTDAGVQRYAEVMSLFFAALAQLQNLASLQPLATELQAHTWQQYAYQAPSPGYDAVAKIADNLLTADLATFPNLPIDHESVDPAAWDGLMQHLTVDRAHTTLMAPPALTQVTTDKQEPRMGARYAILPPPTWPKRVDTLPAGFGIPEANPWMPTEFAVATWHSDTPTLQHPQHMVDDDYASIFVARDRQHRNPRLSVTVDINTPAAWVDDAAHEALYDLWWQAAEDSLQDLRGTAEAAGLHLKITPTDDGMRITLHGFTDKATTLLETALWRLTHVTVTPATFSAQRARLLRIYEDQASARPRDIAYATLRDWRLGRTYSRTDKAAALAGMQPFTLARFCQTLFAQCYTQASFYGNVDTRTAYKFYASINRYLRQGAYPQARTPRQVGRDMTALQKPQHIVVQSDRVAGNAVVIQICEGADNPERKAASTVLNHAIEGRFFDVLRTQQQTAYSVQAFGVSRDGQLFRTFALSPYRLSASDVARRVDDFLQDFVAMLTSKEVSEDEFLAYKAAVKKEWEADVDHVVAGNERLHWLAFDKSENFTLVQQRLEALEKLNYKAFVTYARTALTTPHRAVVLVEGRGYKSE